MRFTAVALLVGLTASRTGHAQDAAPHFSLSWARFPGADACISARTLAERVEARLRRAVFGSPAGADVAIEGSVAPSDGGYRAAVSIADARGTVLGTRELTSSDATCRDLDDSLALTVALFVDPTAALSPAPPASAAAPAVAPEAAPPTPPPPPAPPRASAPSSVLRSSALLGGGVALGLLPQPAPGLVVRIALAPPGAWPVVADGALYRETQESVAPGASAVGFSLAHGGAALCPFGDEGRHAGFRGCAGLDAGLLSTRGLSGGSILIHRRFVAMAAARLEGALYWGHFLVGAGATLAANLVRDSFEYERDGERALVFRASPIGATFDVGIGFRSP